MIRCLPLEIRECRDRRLGIGSAVELVANTLAGGDTEVTVLLPRRVYSWGWGHLLHDRTADQLAAMLGGLPHATATVVPFQVGNLPLHVPGRRTTGQSPPGQGGKKRRRDQDAKRRQGLSRRRPPHRRDQLASKGQDRRASYLRRALPSPGKALRC